MVLAKVLLDEHILNFISLLCSGQGLDLSLTPVCGIG
jgi:hypothetical protein